MKIPLLIIGGGLSGLAAAIRFARYSPDVLLLEKHRRIGGLNSYYYRNGILLETGLHAVTNYASAEQKRAPLNRLFRQLKLRRKKLKIYQQIRSEIVFKDIENLFFTNDFEVLTSQVEEKFPASSDGFRKLVQAIDAIDPFSPGSYASAKKYINFYLSDEHLTDMLLCPLMFYGSSVENDMDLNQFIIMFRSIFQEGMFRPAGSIKSFLDELKEHYLNLGGKIRLNAGVSKIMHNNNTVSGVRLSSGEVLECDHLLSTIGHEETLQLLEQPVVQQKDKRLGFVESIFLVDKKDSLLPNDKTIIFYNNGPTFSYQQPDNIVDYRSGVICFPYNFQSRPEADYIELRSTHLANYSLWKKVAGNVEEYREKKKQIAMESCETLEKFIGKYNDRVIYQDTFTPLTINKYTSKIGGAIYGSPHKIKDGNIGYSNLYLAGTDQGFLGIVGSMLSGVSMVNQHVLPKI